MGTGRRESASQLRHRPGSLPCTVPHPRRRARRDGGHALRLRPGDGERAPGRLGLIRAAGSITIDRYPGSPVYLDVGAYVASSGGAFRLKVTRASYGSPIRVSQAGRGELPAWAGGSWDGLQRFIHYRVRDSGGNLVWSGSEPFCPDGFNLQRLDPSGPLNPTFPGFCGDNPFTLGAVWGIHRGWAVGVDDNAPSLPLKLGSYSSTVSIPPRWVKLFHIPAASARTTIAVQVVEAPRRAAARRPAIAALRRPAPRRWRRR